MSPAWLVLGLLATALGLTDTVTSALLQRRGYVEKNPFLGIHPSDARFAGGFLGVAALLWAIAAYVTPLVVVPWLAVEGYEVARNLAFLRQP